MIGVFAAADIFLFYVFFEVMLVPMYFLIGSYGGVRRQYAAVKFFLYSLVGGLFMLAAVIGLWVLRPHLRLDALRSAEFSVTAERWLFLGFPGVRHQGAVLPVPHLAARRRWRGPRRSGSPARRCPRQGGNVRHPAVLPAAVPERHRHFAPLGLALALIGIVYAALLAVGQNDLKRLVAYTSVAHFGFIGIGIFALTTPAGSGAVLYMVNHGLATGLLFLVVGMLVSRRGSANVGDFGGAGRTLPVLAGVPDRRSGLAGAAGNRPFVSEFLVLAGTYPANKAVAVVATIGIILAAGYVLWMIQRTTHGTPNPELAGIRAMRKDLSWRESIVVGPLVALLVIFGFYPKPLLDVITPAVTATLQDDVGVTDPVPAAVQEASQ